MLSLYLLSILTLFACSDENEPKLGSVKFVFNTQECGTELSGTVTINSKSATVKAESALTAECNRFNPGEKINLEEGSYQYRVESVEGRLWEGTVSLSEGACQIVTIDCPVTTGVATFWMDQDFGCGYVEVYIPGYESQLISSYKSNGIAPECGTEGFASFELEAGTYSYTASCYDRSWQGEVQVSRNRCKTVLLNQTNSEGPEQEYGQATFWMNQDFGCGALTINVSNQYSERITQYYTSGRPSSCSESGNANFTLAPGTYTYQASCDGYTWPQKSFTVYANDCTSTMIQ